MVQKELDSHQTESITLPAHYYQYKGLFRRCAAIQVVFEYFEIKELIKV